MYAFTQNPQSHSAHFPASLVEGGAPKGRWELGTLSRKRGTRSGLPFSEDLWRLSCRLFLFFIMRGFFLFRSARGAAGTSRTAAAVAPAARLALFPADHRRRDDPDDERACRDDDEDLPPAHFFSSRVTAASSSAASSNPTVAETVSFFMGCFLFQSTMSATAAAAAAMKMKHVHHHEPMR